MKKIGYLIAAFGIPGSGKSSTMRELGLLLNARTFHEPEESEWKEAVTHRSLSGNFNAIMWFRAARVPLIYLANELRKKGELVLLDSYYDKLFHLYMSSDGMRWLFSDSDEYNEEMRNISLKDYHLLPEADYLIFFKLDADTWHKFLNKRNRNLDNDSDFLDKCFSSQDHLLRAAEIYSKEKGCKLVIIDQKFDSPMGTAKRIIQVLKNEKLLEDVNIV